MCANEGLAECVCWRNEGLVVGISVRVDVGPAVLGMLVGAIVFSCQFAHRGNCWS